MGMKEDEEKKKNKKTREEILQVMDTPDRCKNNQIAASACKFEESPVFSFLNSLSPIQPVKSTHISQSINPLTFASLPSVFTSPHLNSIKEYRYLRRQLLSDPSKPEFSSDAGSIDDKSSATAEAAEKSDEQKENRDPVASNGEPSYECKSPDSNLRPFSALRPKGMVEFSCSSSATLFVDEASQRGLSGRKENLRGVSLVDQNKEASSCDWDRLISDATDMLIFESPNISDAYKNPETSFYSNIENDVSNARSPCALASGEQVGDISESENLSTQPGEGSEMMEDAEIHDINNPSDKSDFENVCGFYRGMRRRCLLFEMAGARRKQLGENSGSDSPLLLQSNNADTLSTNQQLVSAENESSRPVLPAIGLHLNTLSTTTPKNYKLVRYEATTYSSFFVGTSSSVNIHPPTASHEQLNNDSLAVIPSQSEYDAMDNGVLPVEMACGTSEYNASEDMNQSSSPKKKRRRPEVAMEGEACKRCNCKKSKCLKLYCECFAAGVYCVEPCACIDCFNKPIHEDTVLATRKQIESRNPLAFAPKVIRSSDSFLETVENSSKTPASARHKRGCNCKKSGCLKKYCECYQGGVGCSIGCRCEGCKNAFGRKDGSYAMGMEVETEEDGTDTTEESVVEKRLKRTAVPTSVVQNMDSVPLLTPLHGVRQSVSKNKPPRSSSTTAGSSSLVSNPAFNKPNNSFQPTSKMDTQFETVWEDEIPDFDQGSMPMSGVKSSSPNQKRVSPPQSVRMSPGLRSSRKLILRSIPSFPSLGSSQ